MDLDLRSNADEGEDGDVVEDANEEDEPESHWELLDVAKPDDFTCRGKINSKTAGFSCALYRYNQVGFRVVSLCIFASHLRVQNIGCTRGLSPVIPALVW